MAERAKTAENEGSWQKILVNNSEGIRGRDMVLLRAASANWDDMANRICVLFEINFPKTSLS